MKEKEIQNVDIEHIRNSAISGFFWTFLERGANHFLSFFIGLILVRILEPRDYGLIGMVFIFFGFANSLIDSGFSRALIQNQKADDSDYSTALITNVAIAIILYLLFFLIAPLIGDFFNEQELVLLIRILGLSLVLHSFNIVHLSLLAKTLNFKKYAYLNLFNYVVSGIASVICAYMGFGVWSLVIYNILPSITGGIILWATSDWRFRLQFSYIKFKELISFGYSLTLINLINTAIGELYNSFIGKIYKADTLGYFSRARMTQQLVSGVFSDVMVKVIFPVVSRIQNETDLIIAALRKVMFMTGFLNFPIVIFLIFNAKQVFIILFTEKWLESVWMFQIMAFEGLMTPIIFVTSNILISKGLTKEYTKYEVYKRIIQIIAILLTFRDLKIMLYGIVVLSVIYSFFSMYICSKHLEFKVKDFLRTIFPYFLMIAFQSLLNLIINKFIHFDNLHIQVSLFLIINILFVTTYGYIFKLEAAQEIKIIFNELRLKYRLSKK